MKLNYKINLQLTQRSGQTSQAPWKLMNEEYCSVSLINGVPVLMKVSQNDFDSLEVNYELLNKDQDIHEKMIFNEIAKLYDLNFNLNKFYKFLSKDEKLKPAIKFCNGLRLFLARNHFEAIISSLSSANNSIVRWTKSIDTISSKWGKGYVFPSGTFYTFPSPKILSHVYEDEIAEIEGHNGLIENCVNNLRSCGLGYRASYVKKTSEIFASYVDPLSINHMKYDEAFETLIKIPGVGPKVADCILLYGYGFMEAFPSDVWIKRIISYLYFDGEDIKVEKVRTFGMEKFKRYAGYTQLYLFHFARKSGLMNRLKPRK